jgi:DNA mismatch repair protein MutS2
VGEMLDRTRQKLRRILEQAQDEVRSSVKKLDEIKNRKDLDQTRGQLNTAFSHSASRIEKALEEEAPDLAEALGAQEKASLGAELVPASKLEVGTKVRIPKWKNTGVILELIGGKVKVAMGTLQMNLSLSDIEPLTENEIAALPKSKAQNRRNLELPSVPAPPSQIDLRGTRLEEAMSSLESYLDQAFRSGSLAEVTIVHGLGSGALREGTRKILKGLPYIKTYHDGGAGRGGSGATVVEFER